MVFMMNCVTRLLVLHLTIMQSKQVNKTGEVLLFTILLFIYTEQDLMKH
jgi:hypothetical protein